VLVFLLAFRSTLHRLSLIGTGALLGSLATLLVVSLRPSGRPMPPLSQLVQAVAPDLTADVPGRVGTPQRQGVRLTPHDRAFHRAGLTKHPPGQAASKPFNAGTAYPGKGSA